MGKLCPGSSSETWRLVFRPLFQYVHSKAFSLSKVWMFQTTLYVVFHLFCLSNNKDINWLQRVLHSDYKWNIVWNDTQIYSLHKFYINIPNSLKQTHWSCHPEITIRDKWAMSLEPCAGPSPRYGSSGKNPVGTRKAMGQGLFRTSNNKNK